MTFSDEICKLVIEHIDLLEEAPKVVETVETKIFKDINTRFEEFFKKRDGWKDDGAYTYNEDEDDAQTTFAPVGWPEDEDGSYTAWYGFGPITGAENYEYYLTALTGKTSNDWFGIFFDIDKSAFGIKKGQWKKMLATQYANRSILQESGVKLHEEWLYIPITLDSKIMLDEYPDLDTCLKPIDEALEMLMKVNPEINEILQEVKNQSQI